MARTVEISIDVDCADTLGAIATLAFTVTLPAPDALCDPPVVCFAKPAGSYSRGYFTRELPGPGQGAQAEWHARQGWIFVSCDNLGSGESSRHDHDAMSLAAVTQAAQLAEQDILTRLANGLLARDFPPVVQPVRIGMGHSLGGCLTIVQQAHHRCYDGIAVLGYSVFRTLPKSPPGFPPVQIPWFSRDVPLGRPGAVLNWEGPPPSDSSEDNAAIWAALAWSSYFDDVPQAVIDDDLTHYEYVEADAAASLRGILPWAAQGSSGRAARSVLTPGIVAPEAAAIQVPVLCAMGERDFVMDPHREPQAYLSARSVDLFVCERMGHLHNFASSRQLLWERLHLFGQWCGARLRHAGST